MARCPKLFAIHFQAYKLLPPYDPYHHPILRVKSHLVQIQHPLTKGTFRAWFESPSVNQPLREDAQSAHEARLLPRECREAVRHFFYSLPFLFQSSLVRMSLEKHEFYPCNTSKSLILLLDSCRAILEYLDCSHVL